MPIVLESLESQEKADQKGAVTPGTAYSRSTYD